MHENAPASHNNRLRNARVRLVLMVSEMLRSWRNDALEKERLGLLDAKSDMRRIYQQLTRLANPQHPTPDTFALR